MNKLRTLGSCLALLWVFAGVALLAEDDEKSDEADKKTEETVSDDAEKKVEDADGFEEKEEGEEKGDEKGEDKGDEKGDEEGEEGEGDDEGETDEEEETTDSSESAALDVPKATKFPISVHCGKVMDAEQTTDAVPWRDMDKVLLERKYDAATPEDESTIIERPPAEGEAYAIVTFNVAAKRSLGTHDYVLKCRGLSASCLGVSWDSGPFDGRNWQRVSELRPIEAKLLFEIPPDVEDVSLAFALPVTTSLPSVSVRLRRTSVSLEQFGSAGGDEESSSDSSAEDSGETAASDGGEGEEKAAEKAEEGGGEEAAADKDAGKSEEAKPAAEAKEEPAKEAPKKSADDDWL